MYNRILKTVPEIDLRVKMDAMVHDLAQALEETSCPTSGRMALGFRRRTRSAGNIALISSRPTHSDDSINERLQTRKELSSFVQSDSDEVSANSQCRLAPYPLKKRPTHLTFQTTNIESDSVNENFSPLKTGVRRKRKMKRMDLETVEVPPPRPLIRHPPVPLMTVPKPAPRPTLSLPGPSGIKNIAKKKKIPLLKETDGFDVSGKRKRSVRERSAETDTTSQRFSKTCRILRNAIDDPMPIDRELMSSSSLSSSESDAGIQTNDEGREGDDEQSDWFGEGRPGEETDLESDDPAFQILAGTISHMTPDARQAYSERIERLKEDIDREIRGGRRRVHGERASFSVLTSANEKLSKFLQDCDRVTLRLHAMDQDEQEQLRHLVNLYSLHMRVEDSCPVLSKTTATPRSVHIDLGSLCINDFKKRRKYPQPGPYDGPFQAPETMDIS